MTPQQVWALEVGLEVIVEELPPWLRATAPRYILQGLEVGTHTVRVGGPIMFCENQT